MDGEDLDIGHLVYVPVIAAFGLIILGAVLTWVIARLLSRRARP